MQRLLRYSFITFLLITISLSIYAQVPAIPITPQPDSNLCWNYAEAQQPIEESFEEFIAGAGQGTGIYTYYELRTSNSVRLSPLGFGVYEALLDDKVSLHLEIYSPEVDTQFVRYIFLVNEEQILIGDGKEPFLDAQLNPRELTSYDISLPRLETGVYDILILALSDIDSAPEPIGRPGQSPYRMTLIVGQPEHVSPPYVRLAASETLPAIPHILSLTFGDSLVLWSYPDSVYRLGRSRSLQFNVLTGYSSQSDFGNSLPDPDTSQFALIVFLDYLQVAAFDGQSALYGEVDRNTAYTRIPVSILVEDSGVHEVLIVRIDNPRIPLCILQGPEYGYWLPSEATHVRAAFIVEE